MEVINAPEAAKTSLPDFLIGRFTGAVEAAKEEGEKLRPFSPVKAKPEPRQMGLFTDQTKKRR